MEAEHHDFSIIFEYVFNIYTHNRPDIMMVRQWTLYHAQECKIGVIYPITMNDTYAQNLPPHPRIFPPDARCPH